jgi:hypothetical protein
MIRTNLKACLWAMLEPEPEMMQQQLVYMVSITVNRVLVLRSMELPFWVKLVAAAFIWMAIMHSYIHRNGLIVMMI